MPSLQLVTSVAWVGMVAALTAIGDDNLAIGLWIGGTVALGLLVGRFWVMLVPLAVFVVLTVLNALYPPSGEDDFQGVEALLVFFLVITELLVAVPVAFRTVVRRLN